MGRDDLQRFSPAIRVLSFCHSEITTDRKRVESRKKHSLELGARSVEIVILPGEGEPGKSRVPAQGSASHNNIPASPPLPQQEQRDSGGHGATAKEDLTKKVHLEQQCHNMPCLWFHESFVLDFNILWQKSVSYRILVNKMGPRSDTGVPDQSQSTHVYRQHVFQADCGRCQPLFPKAALWQVPGGSMHQGLLPEGRRIV